MYFIDVYSVHYLLTAFACLKSSNKIFGQLIRTNENDCVLIMQVTQLRSELGEYNLEYEGLMVELQALDAVKVEKKLVKL